VKTLAHKQDSLVILYDSDAIQHPGPHLFSREYWIERHAVKGEAAGRGSALFLDTPFGAAVLRQYLRGGQAAKVSRDRYIFAGFKKSRPLMEYSILEQLFTAKLPAPKPLAAICVREGALYHGWILMRLIPDTMTLADLVHQGQSEPAVWRETGQCIRQFHDHGLIHADLNARNILVDGNGEAYLVDFDRARMRKCDSRAFSANLKRLHRSLLKIWPRCDDESLPRCWQYLREGYGVESAPA